MSHSRIFQYSDKLISKEDYLTDSIFCNNDYLWNKFNGQFCGDYVNELNGDRRIDSIAWLKNSLLKLGISWDGQDVFTLGIGSHDAIRDFWYSRIHKAWNELDKDSIGDFSSRYDLKYALTDPLCMGFGFLFSYDRDLTASDDFFEWLLDLKEEDSFYIGGVLDYHC